MNRAVRRLVNVLLVAVLLYGVAVFYTGYRTIGQSLESFAWLTFLYAMLLATVNYGLRFLRFNYYLRLIGVTSVGVVDGLLVFLSGFVLTVSPGKVGEVFKSVVLAQTHAIPVERTAPIVIAERLTDLIGVVVLIALGSTGLNVGREWAILGALAVSAGLALILWEAPFAWLLHRLSLRVPESQLVPKLRDALRSLRTLARPRALVFPILLSCVSWGFEGMGLWVLLRGFGAKASVTTAVFFYETASLAGALVPVPGGLGIVEAMLREQLVHLGGVPTGAATASMILVRFATLWWAVVLGFLALAVLRVRFPVLRGTDPG